MSSSEPAFVSVLLRERVVTPAQVAAVRAAVTAAGVCWAQGFVGLGFATPEQVLRARGEALHLNLLDLKQVSIPLAIIELVPESIAREYIVLPVGQEGGLLILATSEPENERTAQRLAFIFQMRIRYVLAPHEQIVEAINRHYGQCETESVDSILVEFSDSGAAPLP